MLVRASNLINMPIVSLQTGGPIAWIKDLVVDPDSLKIIAFTVNIKSSANILPASSVREYSTQYGLVVDSIEELVAREDIVKIDKVMDLNFFMKGLKVESRKGSKLGRVEDYTVTDDNFMLQQITIFWIENRR